MNGMKEQPEIIKAGQWVQIHNIVIEAANRAPQVPEDTAQVPLEMWVKGYLLTDTKIGESTTIETVTGRHVEGKLVQAHPVFNHGFGDFVPEIYEIHKMLNEEMKEVAKDD